MHRWIIFAGLLAMLCFFTSQAGAADDWLVGYWEGKFAVPEDPLNDIRIPAVANGKFTLTWDRVSRLGVTGTGVVTGDDVTIVLSNGTGFALKRNGDEKLDGFSITNDGVRHPIIIVRKSSDPAQLAGRKGCEIRIFARYLPDHPRGVMHLDEGGTMPEVYSTNLLVCHDGHLEYQRP